MFFPLFAIVFVGVFGTGMARGLRRAVVAGWLPAAVMLPVWLTAGVGSLTLDLRTAAGLAVVAVAILNPPRGGLGRFSYADLLVLGVVLVAAVSQNAAGILRPLTVPELARKWLLPYLMGRWLLGSTGELPKAVGVVAKVVLALAAYAVAEAFTKVNGVNAALGKTYGLLEQGEGYRWGLKRAHGTFDHPIFFGMALVLLLPWALEAGRMARAGAAGSRWWWALLPKAAAVALFCTVSRGPQLAGMATYAFYLFFTRPRLRVPLAVAAVVLGTLGFEARDGVMALLGKAAGEKSEDVSLIAIDGEQVEYTGTQHRVLLFRVYAKAIENAGLFGFGSELKGVELEESIAQRFSSVDCHYVLFYLQHGYLGVGAFLILTVGILINLLRTALRTDLPQSGLAAGLFGALLSVAVLLMTCWLSPDFAAVWLFSAGLASRLPSLVRTPHAAVSKRSPAAPASAAEPKPVRVAGSYTPVRPPTPAPHHHAHRSPHPDRQPGEG